MSVRAAPANEQMVANGFCSHRWLLWFNDLLNGHVGDAATLNGVAASGYALAAHLHTGVYAAPSVFVPVAWSAGYYSGTGGGGWSVTAGQQTTLRYCLDGKRLTLLWQIDGSTTVTAPTALSLTLPASLAAKASCGTFHSYQTATGGWDTGSVDITASGTALLLYTRTRLSWPTESGTVNTRGSIVLEVV